MSVTNIIQALVGRISRLHAALENATATIATLQKQLGEALASRGAGDEWNVERVVKTFGIYDPGKCQAIADALNGRLNGEVDSELAAAITAAVGVLDRSNAVELLEAMEHREYGTLEPVIESPLVTRMIESVTAAPSENIEAAAAIPVKPTGLEPPPAFDAPDGPYVYLKEGETCPHCGGVTKHRDDCEFAPPVPVTRPLRAADLGTVPRRNVAHMGGEELPKDSPV